MSALLELAGRCESEAADRDLDTDIFLCVRPSARGRIFTAPTYTASLDAALTLMPEGWGWLRKDFATMTAAMNPKGDGWAKHIDGGGSTPALALCAAALRARASIAGDT